MKLTPVSSSNIAAIGWARDKLRVRFIGGNVYEYAAVPAEVFDRLIGAEHVGQLFSQIVRGKFSHKKLDPTG